MSWPVCLPAACWVSSPLPVRPPVWLSRDSQSVVHAVFAPLSLFTSLHFSAPTRRHASPRLTAPICTPTPPRLDTPDIARLRNTRGSCDQLTPLGGAPAGKSSARDLEERRFARSHVR